MNIDALINLAKKRIPHGGFRERNWPSLITLFVAKKMRNLSFNVPDNQFGIPIFTPENFQILSGSGFLGQFKKTFKQALNEVLSLLSESPWIRNVLFFVVPKTIIGELGPKNMKIHPRGLFFLIRSPSYGEISVIWLNSELCIAPNMDITIRDRRYLEFLGPMIVHEMGHNIVEHLNAVGKERVERLFEVLRDSRVLQVYQVKAANEVIPLVLHHGYDYIQKSPRKCDLRDILSRFLAQLSGEEEVRIEVPFYRHLYRVVKKRGDKSKLVSLIEMLLDLPTYVH